MFYYNSTKYKSATGGAAQHFHNELEFYFLKKGFCSYLIEDKLYQINEGDLVLIRKGIIHKTTYQDSHSRMLINCSEDFVEDLPLPGFTVFRNENTTERIEDLFLKIEAEYPFSDPLSEPLVKGYMAELFALTTRNQNYYLNERHTNEHVEKILAFLHQNFAEEISLSGLAADYGISAEHLSRIFKKETGFQFNRYLTMVRMQKAEALLIHSEKSVSEIAFTCGFNDSNYFSEKFKEAFSLSPLRYRKAKQKVKNPK